MTTPKNLILASGSLYRRQQLTQLGLRFDSVSPDINEAKKPNESISELVHRLSFEKALAVYSRHPNAVVIGSDQSAELSGTQLSKPVTKEAAVAQLLACSGNTVIFYTGLCVLGPNEYCNRETVTTEVTFRDLSPEQIHTYIKKEQPLNCAGSFKCEGLGIALFKAIRSDDPSALIGLPLIALTQMLDAVGLDVLTATPLAKI